MTPSPSVTALPTTQPPDEPCDEGAPFTLIIDERINCPLGLPCPPPVNDPYMFPDTAYVVHDTTPAYGDHGWSIKFSADYAYGTTIAHHECHIDPVTGQILACVVTNEQGGILYGHPSTAIQGQGQPASRECTEWLLTYVISGEFLARYSTWPNGQYGPICWELLPPPGRTDPAWRAEIDVPTSAQHMAGFRVANGHDWWPNGPDYFCGRCNGMFGRNFVCQECPQTPVRLCPSSNQMLTVVLDDMPKYQMLFFTQSIQ